MTILGIYSKLVQDEISDPDSCRQEDGEGEVKGAVYTTTMEAMMPDGKALQMGNITYLGQKFSNTF